MHLIAVKDIWYKKLHSSNRFISITQNIPDTNFDMHPCGLNTALWFENA